jgi:hypothetical protein
VSFGAWTRRPTLTHAVPRCPIDVAAVCTRAPSYACQPTVEGLDTTMDTTTLRLRVTPRAVNALLYVSHNSFNAPLAALATLDLVHRRYTPVHSSATRLP